MSELIDIKGKKFGSLLVLEHLGGIGNLWKCKCECGEIVAIGSYFLRKGRQKSCGCKHPNKFVDLTGKRYGKLIVLNFDRKEGTESGHVKYFWKCKCDCGKETSVIRNQLNNGTTKSCGCLLLNTGKDSFHFRGYKDIPLSYYHSILKSAKKRKLEFLVSIEYLWKLFISQNNKCALSSEDIWFGSGNWYYDKRLETTASLDRIDSSKGYVEGNVQWVHKDINIMKNNYDQLRFIDLCKKVASHA